MTRDERLRYEREEKAREEKAREEKARAERVEVMRNSVQEVELQARYWKAMYETKHWTLEDAKLKESYETYFQEVQSRAEDAAIQLEKLQSLQGLGVEDNSQESPTSNIITDI